MNENTSAALEIMGIGMTSIIVVMAIFYGMIILIDKLFPPKASKE